MDKFRRVFQDRLKGDSEVGRKIKKSDAQWKAQLTELQFDVTRQGETEEAFSGEYLKHKGKGAYHCVCCDLALYDSAAKYDSEAGWPSFWAPVNKRHILTADDRSGSGRRVVLKCVRCGARLGQLFNDGPEPTGLRHSINSAALIFKAAEE